MASPKHIILAATLVLLNDPGHAQVFTCGTHVPDSDNLDRLSDASRGGTGLKVIPMIFHVLHTGGSENIGDAQIHNAVDVLNEDYRMHAGDTLAIYPGDTVVTADAQVAFCLATIDPNGEATNGIDRIYSELTHDGMDPAAKLNPWPRASYLNIWVVRSAGTTWGFALNPADAEVLPDQDGVVMRYNYLGGIGASSSILRHTFTHEVGHFLDLLHPWDLPTGFGTCGDDLVSDTPITSPDIYCPTNIADCAPPTVQYLPNFMNFYACQQMFTAGQTVRIRACLNSSVAERNNLWTEANQAATGTCFPLGVAETGGTYSFQVGPNPFQGVVRISRVKPGKANVQVYDAHGSLEFDRLLTIDASGACDLDLSCIAQSGLYLLRITGIGGVGSTTLLRE